MLKYQHLLCATLVTSNNNSYNLELNRRVTAVGMLMVSFWALRVIYRVIVQLGLFWFRKWINFLGKHNIYNN